MGGRVTLFVQADSSTQLILLLLLMTGGEAKLLHKFPHKVIEERELGHITSTTAFLSGSHVKKHNTSWIRKERDNLNARQGSID
jgi:hypothetical protein